MQNKSYLLKIRGGVEVDSAGKRAGKGPLIAEEISHTLGTSQDQYLFQAVGVDMYNQSTTGKVRRTLKCPKGGDDIPCVVTFEPGIASRDGGHVYENISGTLRATPGDNQMTVAFTTEMTPKVDTKGKAFSLRERDYKDPQAIVLENHPNDSRVRIDDSGTIQTLTSRCGTGGGNVPMVMQKVICLQGNGIDRTDTTGCNGKGWTEDVSYTLNTIDRHAVAYRANAYDELEQTEKGATLKACGGNYGGGSENLCVERKRKATEMNNQEEYIVRRLTPLECNRLQGFPDGWGEIDHKDDFTEEEYQFWLDVRNTWAAINGKQVKDYTKEQMLKWYNKLHTDSAEYKMWGNGIGLPNALYVMQGIVRETGGQNEKGLHTL